MDAGNETKGQEKEVKHQQECLEEKNHGQDNVVIELSYASIQ